MSGHLSPCASNSPDVTIPANRDEYGTTSAPTPSRMAARSDRPPSPGRAPLHVTGLGHDHVRFVPAGSMGRRNMTASGLLPLTAETTCAGLRGAACGVGQAPGLAALGCPQGPQGSPGSRPAARRPRQRCAAVLRLGGRARSMCGAFAGYERRRQPPPSGRCGQGLAEGLGRGAPAEGLAGPGVQFGGDRLQVLTAVARQAGALGEVLAQQPVGVFVAAPLPG
jgi:hypothetical protein